MHRSLFGLAAILSILIAAPGHAAQRGPDAATQRLLDAMTRHDLCARDDRQLRTLNRSLAGKAGRPPNGMPAR